VSYLEVDFYAELDTHYFLDFELATYDRINCFKVIYFIVDGLNTLITKGETSS